LGAEDKNGFRHPSLNPNFKTNYNAWVFNNSGQSLYFFPTTEKVVSTEPPRLEAYGVGAVDLGGGGSGGAVAGGSGADGSLADDELPPLGEPSGPVEQVPDFPDLELPGELPQ
jgi:hypothetical protein